MIVAIPTLLRHDAVQGQIHALTRGMLAPDAIRIIDNGRTGRAYAYAGGRLEAVMPPFNIGVAGAWNYALRNAAAERYAQLVVANDDIVFQPNTLARFARAAAAVSDTALVVSGCATEPWSLWMTNPRTFLSVIGEFDQQFYPGYYEDNDVDHRLRLAGAQLLVVETGAVHLGAATKTAMSEEAREQLRQCYSNSTRLYQAKWGGQPPRGELYEAPYDPRVLRGTK